MSSKRNHAGTMVKSVLVAAAFMLAGTTVALADNASKFVPGTKVNGVLVGGMTVEEAKVQIEGFYGREYNLSIKEKGGVTEVIKGSEIGYQVVITDGLQAVLAEQNATGRVAGPAADNAHTLKSTVSFDNGQLEAKLKSLTCVSGSSITVTANAHVSPWQQGVPFTIIPEVQGNSVNIGKLEEVVKAALNSELTEVNLEEAGCYDTITVTSEDAGLKAQCDALNRVREMAVTYTFGNQSEVLTGEEICSWITGMTEGVIGVNGEKAAAYIKSLADKYDTAGRARVFHTTDGRDLSLAGSYGWQLNQAGETAALIELIRAGQTLTREPQYTQAAADRNNDWGGTYIEADMAAQHVYMYKDGALVWDSPCVTGNVSKNYTTPEGIYTLSYKQTDRVLRGAKQADGTYEYESHVDYWMPFNGGIGFHDASWRSKFGGAIYQTGGSHGCVNLPPNKAKALYSLVYSGIPVICHY
ncbi:L,D-transpeptidase family protein [Clostridium sp. Marseille-P2415]|uniref:L,D-transpeptidase family protein n=1 Tax=Clostridium sp. Marseille-P2415 TaxID=1805471 RepID=UPI000988351F|nr:L,D-transpeptidase family protein [Clostridium sp. Marseille-P2415]